jgi:DNA polymerase III alpha subunit (gram-positive type)
MPTPDEVLGPAWASLQEIFDFGIEIGVYKVNYMYVSVDIEADGPIPGDYSMRSLGAVAFKEDGTVFSSFTTNLDPLPDAKQDADTMTWWAKHPEAWMNVNKDRVHPESAMLSFNRWMTGLPGIKVFVGYPASYDFLFVYWYLIHFTGFSPFGFQALDLKTLAMAKLGIPFKEVSKKRMPKEWFEGLKHTHVAVEDAEEQGKLFFRMMKHEPA